MKKPNLRKRGVGFFGKLDCPKYSLPAFLPQFYSPVLSQILPVLPGVWAVCREVAV